MAGLRGCHLALGWLEEREKTLLRCDLSGWEGKAWRLSHAPWAATQVMDLTALLVGVFTAVGNPGWTLAMLFRGGSEFFLNN
jgi:hypothetical protein